MDAGSRNDQQQPEQRSARRQCQSDDREHRGDERERRQGKKKAAPLSAARPKTAAVAAKIVNSRALLIDLLPMRHDHSAPRRRVRNPKPVERRDHGEIDQRHQEESAQRPDRLFARERKRHQHRGGDAQSVNQIRRCLRILRLDREHHQRPGHEGHDGPP